LIWLVCHFKLLLVTCHHICLPIKTQGLYLQIENYCLSYICVLWRKRAHWFFCGHKTGISMMPWSSASRGYLHVIKSKLLRPNISSRFMTTWYYNACEHWVSKLQIFQVRLFLLFYWPSLQPISFCHIKSSPMHIYLLCSVYTFCVCRNSTAEMIMPTRKWRNLLSDAFIRRFVRYSENYPKTNKDKAFNKVCSPSSNCHNYCESTLVGMHCRKYKTHVTKNFEDYI
jgi:hypothetical protein